jgi:cell wall-associated NlpC family hydrolase
MTTQGVVLASVANLHSQPDTGTELVTQAVLGSHLQILESSGTWHHVQLPDQYRGWIEARHARLYAAGEPLYAATGPLAEVQQLMAFLHHEPEGSAAPARQVTLGARLEAAEEQAGWLQVILPDDSLLWVRRGAVTLVEAGSPWPRGDVDQLIRTAKHFLGLPYQWGGCTPLGIDCSGFVQLVYRLHGVSLLRDARIQFTQPNLVPVEKEDLQTGDLVFFGQDSITHVGLYMGEGEFIHATVHIWPIVQISRLDEAHWTERYRGARRP